MTNNAANKRKMWREHRIKRFSLSAIGSTTTAAISHGRHFHLNAVLRALRLEHSSDFGIFILVFDLLAEIFLPPLPIRSDADISAGIGPAQSHVQGRLLTGAEMRMPPHVGRRKHDSRFPIDAHALLSIRPHQRVTFSTQNSYMSAGRMAMGFFIVAGALFGDVTGHGVFR